MSEVLLRYTTPITGSDGRAYDVAARGRPMDESRWEGWLEFVSAGGTATHVSARETTQPNRTDLVYWATGLTPVYLEGALERAMSRAGNGAEPAPRMAPVSSAPASYERTTPPGGVPRAVLDPFAVYAQGPDVLERELGALSTDHLSSIVKFYGLGAEGEPPLDRARSRAELAAFILGAVKERALGA